MTVSQAFSLALQHHQAGRLAEAEALYERILSVQPTHRGAVQNLGVAALQTQRRERAIHWLQKAVSMDPDDAVAQFNLGEGYRADSRMEAAMACYRQALAMKPGYPEARHRLGTVLAQLDRAGEAIAAFRDALALAPRSPAVRNELGVALAEQGWLEEAVTTFCEALEMSADYPETHLNLGQALCRQGKFDEAAAAFQSALRLKPEWPFAWFKLADAFRERGRFAEACEAYRRGLRWEASDPAVWNNLGNALFELGGHDEAAGAYRRALELNPHHGGAHSNLAALMTERGQLDEAVAALRQAAALMPEAAVIQNNLGNALKDAGRPDEAVAAYRRAIELQPDFAMAHSNLVYALQFEAATDAEVIAEELRRWNRQFSEPRRRFVQSHANERSANRRLVIGYITPEFRDHVTGRYLAPLFEGHDHRDFEIICYSATVRKDHLTQAFRQRADRWREIAGATDEAVVKMIREDAVDVLVDLTQHVAGNRLTVFAHRPAPVQVSFAGYPGSTGLESIPYRISDRYLETEMGYGGAERVFLLDSFWCYHPCGVEVDINALPAITNGGVAFGCLNNFGKVNERVLKCWAGILREVRDSRLLLLSPTGSHRQRTEEIFRSEGVKPDRIEFLEKRDRRSYLELYQRVDVALDPFPVNGHTTSLDALWMGVPVVTLAGRTPFSRAGLGFLMNLGLPEFIAQSEADYVRIAIEAAADLSRLEALRQMLRPRMAASVLMDARGFTKGIEAAYRTMWRRWCAGAHW